MSKVKIYLGHAAGPDPSKEAIDSLLSYDRDTGVFLWLSASGRVSAGSIAGGYNDQGYILIGFGGKKHRAHRLAWILNNGTAPTGQIDHINGIKDDNRISNLRDVSPSENQKNRRIQENNTSGVNGVYWNKKMNKWHARIKIDGNYNSLGFFSSLSDAKSSREEANEKHLFHANHGQQKTGIEKKGGL